MANDEVEERMVGLHEAIITTAEDTRSREVLAGKPESE
jgi:hypothetical protein